MTFFYFTLLVMLLFYYVIGIGVVFITILCEDNHRDITEQIILCLLSWYAYYMYLNK